VGIYLYTEWDKSRFEAELPTPPTVQEPPVSDTTTGGHSHDAPHTPSAKSYIPEPPENDPFFASIVFPDTPPSHQHNHKAPFPPPEVVLRNPHLFEVNEYGWHAIETPELEEKLIQMHGSSLKGEDRDRKLYEMLTEDIDDPATAYFYLRGLGFVPATAGYRRALLDRAFRENPNDFDICVDWARINKTDKPAEAEAVLRRVVKMQPDHIKAQSRLAEHLLETRSDPSEAIPHFEAVYQLNPKWHPTLIRLGEVYLKLEQPEKALKYFQASLAFERTVGAATGAIRARRLIAEKQQEPVE